MLSQAGSIGSRRVRLDFWILAVYTIASLRKAIRGTIMSNNDSSTTKE